MDCEFDVCVVGAGPVGLTLALELSRHGVAHRASSSASGRRSVAEDERCNARHDGDLSPARRGGRGPRPRPAGRRFDGRRHRHESSASRRSRCSGNPTVQDLRRRIAECTDGTLPLEALQVISQ